MSVFRCGKCEGLFDSDYEGCFENPLDDWSNICERCSMELEVKEKKETPEFKKFVNDIENQSDDENYDGPGDEYYENLMSQEHSA